jgi:uncharacterized cupredoxin-like copper-binding protein
MRYVRHGVVVVAFAGAGMLAACSENGSSEDVIQVAVNEQSFSMPSETIEAGDVTFSASNEASSVHELEVFTVPDGVDATSLEITNNVADTEGAGMDVVDEVEDIAPGTTADLTVNLDPGTYALICNLPGHYAEGMVLEFEVA